VKILLQLVAYSFHSFSLFPLSTVNLGQKSGMTSRVVYNGGLRTTLTHLKSGSEFETDAPVDNHGKGEKFSPTDIAATSLATCMLTTMGIKARSMGFDLDGMEADVLKIMKPDPRRIGAIEITFHIPASLNSIDDNTKTLLKHIADTCPVAKSLHPDIEIKVNWDSWA